MTRGDIVTVAAPGDYGKPRPAVVVQSDLLAEVDSVLVCPLTSVERDVHLYRMELAPSPANGLRLPSFIMVDKVLPMPRRKCGSVIGRLTSEETTALDGLLALVMGLRD